MLSEVIKTFKNNVECVKIQLNLQQIFDQMEDLLSNLETATNLAQHNIIHNFFLPLKNIRAILNQLHAVYEQKEIINLSNLHSYYNLFLISINVLEYKIVIKLTVPLFFPESYVTYNMIPIPINGQTIVPPQPYLHANLDTHQHLWLTEPCPSIEEFFLCKGTFQIQQDQCFLPLIQNKPYECPTTNVELQSTLLEQLKNNQILILPLGKEVISEQCRVKQSYSIDKPSLVTMDSCDVIIKDIHFSIKSDPIGQTQIHLPTIDLEPSGQPTIHLQEMELQDFQHLDRLTKNLRPVHLKDFEDIKSTNIIFYILLIVLVIIILLGLYYQFGHKKAQNWFKFKNSTAPSSAVEIPLKEGGVI